MGIHDKRDTRILVTGASGYVGGRLVPALEARGERVRCLARTPRYLEGRFSPITEIVRGDALDPPSLDDALRASTPRTTWCIPWDPGRISGSGTASVRTISPAPRGGRGCGGSSTWGGLGPRAEQRHRPAAATSPPTWPAATRWAACLASHGPPTIEFRASIIIGSGSLSFELIRGLVNRLPVMVTPRWVRARAQPIAIGDVIAYLLRGLDLEADGNEVFEIGGPERVTYGELMREYARQTGVRRVMIPVPLLTPRLSSLWLGLVTPLHARVGRKLIDSLRNETVVHDARALERSSVRPLGVRQAIARALKEEDRQIARTRWSDAVSSSGGRPGWGGRCIGSRVVDRQQALTAADPARAFAPIQRIGGQQGWYFATWLWSLRGALDQLLGGVGMRRGRRHPVDLQPGDPLDFWRVEAFKADRLLSLRAEMKVPGRAWLQFEVEPAGGGSRITQTAIFDPRGLGGLLYWYALYPVHWLIFRGMLRGIVRAGVAGRSGAGVVWRVNPPQLPN